jgi:5-methylcytosine-specific restriction endonuclease McrA
MVSGAWLRLRAAALARDGYRCTAPGCGERAVTVDHIVSRRRGGPDVLGNVRSLCRAHDNQVKEAADGRRRSGGLFRGCDATGAPLDRGHWWNR